MSIENKSVLARLMATENLSVVHKKVPTASFNVKSRVLTLPILKWEAGTDVYDLFVCHEVGHALFTPEDGWHSSVSERGAGFKSFLNVVEDARIEKKIKRRYPGTRKSMSSGYTELFGEDFFGVKQLLASGVIESYGDLPLIDRINLFTKIGPSLGIPFSEEENNWLREIERLESFEDALDLALRLYEYAKDEVNHIDSSHHDYEYGEDDEDGEWEEQDGDFQESGDQKSPSEYSNSNGDSEDEDGEEKNSSSNDPLAGNEDDDFDSTNNAGKEGGEKGSPSSYTDDKFREMEKNLVTNDTAAPLYFTVPEIDLNDFVVDYKEIHTIMKDHLEMLDGLRGQTNYNRLSSGEYLSILLQQFKKNNDKTVNYMVKEFEMKKAATEYRRAGVSKKGTLNMSKIYSYKFSDNLFQQVVSIRDGKNHGLMMFIDWSGSMGSVIKSTIDQLVNLVMFCSKVNIPFEVFAFSDSYRSSSFWRRPNQSDRELSTRYKHNDLCVRPDFALLNLFSSRMTKQELVQAYKNVLLMGDSNRLDNYYNSSDIPKCHFELPNSLQLGGTPLNDTILVSRTLIDQFKESNKIEIVNAVFLTDGASHTNRTYWDATQQNALLIPRHEIHQSAIYLDDPKTKVRKRIGMHFPMSETSSYFKFLRETTKANVIGFYLTSYGKVSEREVRSAAWDVNLTDDDIASFRKNKFLVVSDEQCCYDELYVIQSKALDIDTTNHIENLDANAKRGMIRKAFTKNTSGKLKNRVILTKFVEKVA